MCAKQLQPQCGTWCKPRDGWTWWQDDKAWIHGPGGTTGWAYAKMQPVWVCLAEAAAFCRFHKCRIMSELEYQRVLDARDARWLFGCMHRPTLAAADPLSVLGLCPDAKLVSKADRAL